MDSIERFESLFDETKRLFAQLQGGDVDQWFQPGLSEVQVKDVEARCGYPIPGQLRACVQVHNSATVAWEQYDLYLQGIVVLPELSIELAESIPLEHWDAHFTRLFPGTRVPRFGSQLVPFADSGHAELCIDLNPGQGGRSGQVVAVDFEEGSCKVVATDLVALLEELVRRLRTAVAR